MTKEYAAGVAARNSRGTTTVEAVDDEPPVPMEADKTTLYSLFINNRSAFDTSAGMLMAYIQRNDSYEVQKAVAISIMATEYTQFS